MAKKSRCVSRAKAICKSGPKKGKLKKGYRWAKGHRKCILKAKGKK